MNLSDKIRLEATFDEACIPAIKESPSNGSKPNAVLAVDGIRSESQADPLHERSPVNYREG